MTPSHPGLVESAPEGGTEIPPLAAPARRAPALLARLASVSFLRSPNGISVLEILGYLCLVLTLVSGLALYNGLHQAQVAYRPERPQDVELIAEALPSTLPADPKAIAATPTLPHLPRVATPPVVPPGPITLVTAQAPPAPAAAPAGSTPQVVAAAASTPSPANPNPSTPPANAPVNAPSIAGSPAPNPSNDPSTGPRITPAGAALAGQITDDVDDATPSIVIRARPQNP
jgi:hypothetical protein